MSDFMCRCPGMFPRPEQCEEQATEEDGLCDNCRTKECERLRDILIENLREKAPDIAERWERVR